ncbi:MAG: hypothetical protein AABX07_05500 [Nanoarchaeota archaeon]
MNLSTQEQVIALYSFFPGMKFDFDAERYHSFFYKLKKEQRPFFQNLSFDFDGRFPTSPDLSEIDGILMSTEHIHVLTPYFQQRVINPICKFNFERNLKRKLCFGEIGQLELIISKQFKEALDARPLFDGR